MENKLLDRIQRIKLDRSYEVSKYDEAIMKLYQNYTYLKNARFDINFEKNKFLNYALSIPCETRLDTIYSKPLDYIWSMKPRRAASESILEAIINDKYVIFAEDTFLRCIVTPAQLLPQDKIRYQFSCGYILDDLTAYFDSTRPSRMELTLNSDFEVPKSEIERCRKLIKKIISNKISKYNNQPIYKPNFGRPNRKKVLVIDQSYKDYSILKGGADDNTFKLMLDSAIKENPDCDILIKTHPDAIGKASKKPVCYYQGVKEAENIFRITDFINPISMIEYVDKVYVCSSQFGFEALMCGKEVHTFGLPFYANWGLTTDNQKLPRRTRKRTLEEIFYIAYIMFSVYVNPKTNQPCEIEEAIDYLLELREEYFKEYNVRNE